METTKNLTSLLESQLIENEAKLSEVGAQREQNHRYYTMQPLGNEIEGRSQYVSADTMDVVESKKSYFREAFFSGRQVCKFLPGDRESKQDADAKTAYVERQLKKNHWYQLFRDGLHDAFVAKRCVYHVEWLEDSEYVMLDVTGADPMQIQWQIQQMDGIVGMDDSGMEMDEAGNMHGTMRVEVDRSRVALKLIQPERYYRDPYASYPEDSSFVAYEEDLTRSDLVDQGYDPEQIASLKTDHKFRREEEDNARKAHDSSWTRRRQHKRVEEQEIVTTYWSYTYLDLSKYIDDAPDDVRLYKIRWGMGEVLRYPPDENGESAFAIEEVSEMPFIEWSQYKVSHAESGMCDADVIAHTQKTASTLKRLAIDNQQMRNSSRWEAVQGAIKNPRDLLNNSIGGVLWTRQLGSVQPLPAPELSPMTMNIMEMLDRDKEDRTGNSRLSKGVNSDAMSNQNAGSMIDRLTNASNRRVMNECRDYAETLLVPLMRQIYRLGVRHDRSMYQFEVAGQQMQASPEQWSEPAPECAVQVALTPEEGAKQAMGLMQMHQMMSMDPVLGQLYGAQQRHALMDDLFDALGVSDTSRYMIMPGSPEHQQMMMQQQQEMMQQQQQMMQQQMMQQQLMQSADQREWQRVRIEEAEKISIGGLNTAQDNQRADEELEHKKVIDFEKLALERAKLGGVA